MRAYEISDLARDLVRMAHYLLTPGGRLVFFLPTVSEDYAEIDLPTCEGMRLVGNSVQDFGKWARRVCSFAIPHCPLTRSGTHEHDSFLALAAYAECIFTIVLR